MITYHHSPGFFLVKPGSSQQKPGSLPQPTNPSLKPNCIHQYRHSCSSSSSFSRPSSCNMALAITRHKHRSFNNPSLIHLFSTSSSSSSPPPPPQNDTDSPSQSPPEQQQRTSISSYFTDVKASLRQQSPPSQKRLNSPPLRRPANTNISISRSTAKDLEEIKKNLSEYRRRSSVPSPAEISSSNDQQKQQMSFQELYKRDIIGKSENGSDSGGTELSKHGSGVLGFEKIRESLRQMRSNSDTGNRGGSGRDGSAFSFSGFGDSSKLIKESQPFVIGGTGGLPLPTLKKDSEDVQGGMSTEFVKAYGFEELGDKLRSLRPEVKDGEKVGFSLEELNERLRKLREIEEKEIESRISGAFYKNLREGLVKLQKSDQEKAMKSSVQSLNLLGQLSTTPDFMSQPPKEHLVEKYFHPDNMSSAEKLKIELSKVREEFKMSESDCGSARVQVAQLTTKIKHLSSVLHKKDKHSRKGLQEMVQKRKKLLKYLRRTDWDSYCFVLSKLGLRDNPDFKYLSRN